MAGGKQVSHPPGMVLAIAKTAPCSSSLTGMLKTLGASLATRLERVACIDCRQVRARASMVGGKQV